MTKIIFLQAHELEQVARMADGQVPTEQLNRMFEMYQDMRRAFNAARPFLQSVAA